MAALALIFAVIGLPGEAPPSEPEDVLLVDLSRSHHPDRRRLLGAARVEWERRRSASQEPLRLVVFGDGDLELIDAASSPPDWAAIERRVVALAPRFTEGSGLATALDGIARRTAAGRWPRIVLFGDGRHDAAALDGSRARLARRGGSLEFVGRLVAEPENLALRLAEAAPSLRPGVAARVLLRLEGRVRSPRRVIVGTESHRQEVRVRPGTPTVFGFELRPPEGARRVRLRILSPDGPDAHAADDTLDLGVGGRVAPQLLICGRRASAVAAALRSSGAEFAIEVTEGAPTRQRLEEAELVILADLPLDPRFAGAPLVALDQAVRSRGVGLVALGGPGSFRAGSWHGAGGLLEGLLPLSSRPPGRRTLRVLLDVSGSMEAEGRLGRAVEATLRLAEAAGPEDRLQVLPFASSVFPPIPDVPRDARRFARDAAPTLSRLEARGGTRLGPLFERVLALPRPAEGRRETLILLSDLNDDSPNAAAQIPAFRERLADRDADLVVVLLDPEPETEALATALGGRLVRATAITPRLLLEEVQREGWRVGSRAAVAMGGALGTGKLDALPAWNPTVLAEGATLLARFDDGEPLAARVRRGAGEVLALATDPLSLPALAARLPGFVRAALPARDAAAPEVRRTLDGGVVLSGPESLELRLRPTGSRSEIPLREVAPRVWRARGVGPSGGVAAVVDGEGRLLARVVVPPGADPETAAAPLPGEALSVGGGQAPAAPGPRRRGLPGALAALLLLLLALRRRPGPEASIRQKALRGARR